MSEALDRTTAWDARKALLRRGVGIFKPSLATVPADAAQVL